MPVKARAGTVPIYVRVRWDNTGEVIHILIANLERVPQWVSRPTLLRDRPVKARTKAETFEPLTMGHGAPPRIPTGTSVVRPR
jgi:hypothetical protein